MESEQRNTMVGMIQWERETEKSVSSSPVIPRSRLNSDQTIWTENYLFSELELKTLASTLPPNDKTSRRDVKAVSADKMIPLNPEKSRCRRLAGCAVAVSLQTAIIALLTLLYFQLGALLRNVEEAGEQCMNRSRQQQEINVFLQRNISSFIRERNSLQEQTLSRLQHKETQHQQETERLERQMLQYQELYSNYSILQDTYRQLRDSHLFIPRDSALLQNCPKNLSGADGVVCPFCSAGWQFFGVSCYMLSHRAESWQGSLRWCRMEGGHLAVVNDLEEQYFLQGLVKKTSWIGLSDLDFEGAWRWVDGTPYSETKAKSWMLNQPNNSGNEDCVTISPASGWNDDKCLKSYHSVCEHRAFQLVLHADTISN